MSPEVPAPRRRLRLPKISISRPHLKLPKFLKSKKFWIVTVVTLVVISIGGYFGLVRPVQAVLTAVDEAKVSALTLTKSYETLDVVRADEELAVLKTKIGVIEERVKYFSFLGVAPFIGDYYRDTEHFLRAGKFGIDAADVLNSALIPYADAVSFSGATTTTAEQKLQALLPIMPKIAPATDAISEKLHLVREELTSVDPNRYPEDFRGVKVKETLQLTKDLVDEIDAFMPQAKEVLLVLPGALGSPTPKTYFVLFQNDKELRSTGGFLTAYTYMTVRNGKVSAGGSENITKIDTAVTKTVKSPAPILKYLPLVPNWYPRDANLSPDFVVSMKKFEDLASTSTEYKSNDGIIAVDTYLLQDLLRLTGPVNSLGDTFTPENVVEKLEIYAEVVFSGRNDRKAFLGDLMKQILQKLVTAGKDQWLPIIETAVKNGNEKHFLLWSRDSETQSLIEKYNWGGRIKEYSGDYLHINDTNFAGAKANLYIKEKIIQDITIDGEGNVTKKVTVEVTNPEKHDGWLNGPYRDWIRMYVPLGSEFISYEGGEVKTSTTGSELGKTMFESFIIARPLGTSASNKATWSVTYKLPFKVQAGEYKLLHQKQPGVEGPEILISINGQVKASEQLRSDKEFTFTF